MIVSDSCRPITSSRVQPNVAAAWAFHETIRPSESMPMKQSWAESSTIRARASLSARFYRLPPVGVGEGDDDEIGQRQGEVLLVELPGPWTADVLDAHDAKRPIFRRAARRA